MSSILDGSLRISSTNTPTREGERIGSIGEMSSIQTPYVGMRVFVEDEKRDYVILSLKAKMVSGVFVPNGAVDKYDAAARVSDLDGFDENVERVEQELRTAISTEQNRASSAEQSIRSNVSALEEEIGFVERRVETEESRAKAAEGELRTAIATEQNRASSAEQQLRSDFEALSEETFRGDAVLANRISDEESRATAAENELRAYSEALSEETFRGDAVLANRISDEESRATKKEGQLMDEISNLKDRLIVRVVTEEQYAAIENKNDGVLYAILEG